MNQFIYLWGSKPVMQREQEYRESIFCYRRRYLHCGFSLELVKLLSTWGNLGFPINKHACCEWRLPLLRRCDKQALTTYETNSSAAKTSCFMLSICPVQCHHHIIMFAQTLLTWLQTLCDCHFDGLVYCGLFILHISRLNTWLKTEFWLHFACLCSN